MKMAPWKIWAISTAAVKRIEESAMESKAQIRKRILEKRNALTPTQRMRSEILVTERILGHQWYYKASEILFFASCGSEISTRDMIKDAFASGKRVYLPRVEGEDMQFYQILPDEPLVKGYGGIWEPAGDKERLFVYEERKKEAVLMLMPGAAFDPMRNRIGYGKGFYDRYLADKRSLHTIAIGFDCQMTAEIESCETDIRPMQVICL